MIAVLSFLILLFLIFGGLYVVKRLINQAYEAGLNGSENEKREAQYVAWAQGYQSGKENPDYRPTNPYTFRNGSAR